MQIQTTHPWSDPVWQRSYYQQFTPEKTISENILLIVTCHCDRFSGEWSQLVCPQVKSTKIHAPSNTKFATLVSKWSELAQFSAKPGGGMVDLKEYFKFKARSKLWGDVGSHIYRRRKSIRRRTLYPASMTRKRMKFHLDTSDPQSLFVHFTAGCVNGWFYS